MTTPRITVLLSVYNCERYLAEAITSIRAQTCRDFEFLIMDDGSTDGSAAIAEQAASEDARIRVVRQKNQGLTRTLNDGLRLARGEFIARQDDDDISLPTRLDSQLQFMETHPRTAVVGCRYWSIDPSGVITREHRVPSGSLAIQTALLTHNVIAHSGAFFRREAAVALGGYNTDCRTAQDYDLWCRMAQDHDLANLSQLLLQRRDHENRIGVTLKADQQATRDRIIADYRTQIRKRSVRSPADLWLKTAAAFYNLSDRLFK